MFLTPFPTIFLKGWNVRDDKYQEFFIMAYYRTTAGYSVFQRVNLEG